MIEWDSQLGRVIAVYYDIGEEESTSLSFFSRAGRTLLTEDQRKEYWRTAMLGAEPPERLYKREKYHEQNIIHNALDKAETATNYADYAFMEIPDE